MKECQHCKLCYADDVDTCPEDGMPTLHTIAGRWIDPHPSTGLNRPPRELRLKVRSTHGGEHTHVANLLEDGSR